MVFKVRLYSYSTCTTCRKAIKWLDDHDIRYDLFDIVKDPPSREMLIKALNLFDNRKKLLNTSGISYRELGAKVVNLMSDSELLDALVKDGKLIKRPFLIVNTETILVGFKVDEWIEKLVK